MSLSSVQARSACLEALPQELKLLILEQSGPNPYTIAAMQQVNRDWRRLAQDDSLWAPLVPQSAVRAGAADAALPGPRLPQTQLGAYLAHSPRHLRRALRQLWHSPAPLAALTPASCDPVFICHARLALVEPTQVPWRWSPLHARNQSSEKAGRLVACPS